MMPKYKQYFFLLIVFVLLFGVGAISFFFSKHAGDTEQFIIEKFGNQQVNFANNIKGRIENDFEHIAFYLKFLLMDKAVYHALADIASGRSKEKITSNADSQNDIAEMITEILEHPYYLYLVISDREGNPKAIAFMQDGRLVVSATDNAPPLPLAKLTPMENEAVTLQLRQNSLLPESEIADRLEVIETVVPLYGNGRHLGWAGIGVDFSLVTEIISNQSDEENNHNWIFDWDGSFIYCSFIPSSDYHSGEMKLLKNLTVGSHEASTHEENGNDLLSFVKLKVGENRWNIVVETELEYMTGYVRASIHVGMALLIVILLTAVMGVFLLYRSAINRDVAEKTTLILNKVQESKEKYRSIFNSTPNPVFLLDESFIIIDKNAGAAKTFHHKAQDLAGKPVDKIIPEIERYAENIGNASPRVKSTRWDTSLVNHSGELMYFSNSLTIVKENSGIGKLYLLYMHNITELKTLQNQLAQSEKLASIGEFIAGIAHEINNPMTGILGYSELLMTEAKDSSVRDDAGKIHKEALRCSRIVSGLLTFARQQREEKSIVSILDAVDASLETIGYDIESSNIQVEKKIETNLKPVYGNIFELEQVILNIINNAVFFLEPMDGGKKIWITARSGEGTVELKIENNGPPIDDDKLGKIFDPFFTTKATGRGTGLGLSISYGIIHSHKGELYAKNGDRGVEFSIVLPAVREETIS